MYPVHCLNAAMLNVLFVLHTCTINFGLTVSGLFDNLDRERKSCFLRYVQVFYFHL